MLSIIEQQLVEKGKYFTINRPRQYGKTTLLYLMEIELEKMGYLVFDISFEGVSDSICRRGIICAAFPLKKIPAQAVDKQREL